MHVTKSILFANIQCRPSSAQQTSMTYRSHIQSICK